MTWTNPLANTAEPRDKGTADEEGLVERLAATLTPHYTIVNKLGSGGFGSVYRAVHANTGQEVAVKVLRPQAAWSPSVAASQIARFEREAALCAGLRHPSIVRLLDKGRTPDDIYYAVYELVPGETLRALLDREGPLSAERVADIMGQVLDALATAHAAGVVHRDLKPANIMLQTIGRSTHVKVLDFGISTLTLEARDTAFHNLTRSHELVGTPKYCAPEQLRGDVPTTKTDHYAWGLMFIECLTNQLPIAGSTLAEIYHEHLSPVEIALPNNLVGHPLGDFLRRVLRKDPAERAGDAAQLHAELRRMHLGDLVGSLQSGGSVSAGACATETSALSAAEPRVEQRHVTVVALRLRLVPTGEHPASVEALDPVLRDQLSLCRDALVRYGGTITGQLGDQLVAMFGYPSSSDTDARRAVRTVLEMSEDLRKRSERLSTTSGLVLEMRTGIHSGHVTVFQGQIPEGITPAKAVGLASAAPANTILLSAESARLLEPFAEMESGDAVGLNGEARPAPTSRLTGERRGEALTFRPGQSGSPPFIGRRIELSQLERLLHVDGRGGARLALVIGEPGIGKSRLVRELLVSARQGSLPVDECRCLAEQRNTALSPILPILARSLGLSGADGVGVGERMIEGLAAYGLDPRRFVPILCVWLSTPLPPGFEPAVMAPYRQRELLLEALVTILARAVEGRARVVLVEDVHWADPTTLELLGRLLDTQGDPPPFLLCTARPEFDVPWKSPQVTRMNLDRLSLEDGKSLARQAWVGPNAPNEETLSTIAERADGIPLFVEELTRMLAEQGGSTELRSIPATLRSLLAGRLDGLGDARSVAQIAAVLGREFDGAILLATAGVDEPAVARALRELTQAKLVYRRRLVVGSTYVFRHALIRDTAYESMPAEIRRKVHAHVASVLEHQFPDTPHSSPGELARHHAGAGAFEAAIRRGTEAALASLAKSSNAEATAQAEQVAAWLSELPDEARVDAELRLNGVKLQALMSVQGWAAPSVRALAEKSRELLPRSKEIEHTVSTLFGLYMHHHVAGERAACRRVADELVELADRLEDPSLRSVAATAKGVNFHAEGRFLEAEAWLEKARGLYDPARDHYQASSYGMDCRVWSTAQLALVQWGIGRSTRSLSLANEAIAWAREIKHVPSLGIALLYISQIHQMNGDKPAALASTGELLEASKTFGLPAFEGYGATIASWAAGDLRGVATIIGILKSINCNLILTYYGSFLADIEADASHFDEAIGYVKEYLALGDRLGEHVFEAELWRRRAVFEMRLASPDASVALDAFHRARELAREQGMSRFEAAAIADQLHHFGRSPALEERLDGLRAAFPDLTRPRRPETEAPKETLP